MSAPGIFTLPQPVNEPVRDYAPGSPEREELRVRLAEMQRERIEIPLVIGGEEVRTGDTFQANTSASSSGAVDAEGDTPGTTSLKVFFILGSDELATFTPDR